MCFYIIFRIVGALFSWKGRNMFEINAEKRTEKDAAKKYAISFPLKISLTCNAGSSTHPILFASFCQLIPPTFILIGLRLTSWKDSWENRQNLIFYLLPYLTDADLRDNKGWNLDLLMSGFTEFIRVVRMRSWLGNCLLAHKVSVTDSVMVEVHFQSWGANYFGACLL